MTDLSLKLLIDEANIPNGFEDVLPVTSCHIERVSRCAIARIEHEFFEGALGLWPVRSADIIEAGLIATIRHKTKQLFTVYDRKVVLWDQ